MRLIGSTLLAGVLAFGAIAPAAFADPPRRHDNRDNRGGDWNNRGDYRDGRRDDRRDDRRDNRRDHRNDRGWYDARGDHHDWRRGDRFDRRVQTRYVVVNDYRSYRDYNGYRLNPPRRGEYYVRDDNTGEILLIAAATGLVLWALSN
jgi:Ni/Co efflux regulator RcnB